MKNGFYILIFLAAFFGFFVLAQSDDSFNDITYPIPELGNCESRQACGVFCDEPDNTGVCLDFAEANDLIPLEEIEMARKMLALGETDGPGGCQGKTQCDAYCDDINNIKECVAFAEKYDLMPSEELAEAKKVAQALEQGLTPPNNCKGKEECDAFCRQPANMKECITFAKAADLIPPEELEEAEKVLAAIEKGAVPPPCGRKDECEDYCSAPENFESCITFAEAAGFVSPEEAAMARKTGGRGPGDCRGKEECDAFCEDPANMEECINFGEEFGFMSHEEAEQARKMLAAGITGGPGGCKGKECETYCDDVNHMEECLLFADAAGLIPPEQLEESKKIIEAIKKGVHMLPCRGQEECDAYCSQPENMEECINFSVAAGFMPPEEAEKAKRGMEMMQSGGLGGCRSEEECRAYCEDPAHGIECMNYAIEHGLVSPEEAQQMQQQMQQMQPSEGMPPEGMMPPEEGMMPEGGFTQPPSPEEIQMIREQIMQDQQQQMQQQIQQQIEQQMQQILPSLPPQETPFGEVP